MDVGIVRDEHELAQILALQQQNLVATVDGFVTVRHTLEILRAMHAMMPSIVARDGEVVVGYALAMHQDAQSMLPILGPMFGRLAAMDALRGKRWYVMGQVCVDAAWRGRGVFDALYAQHRVSYGARFDCLVTEIAMRNPRSLRAHERVGFTVVDRYRDDTDDWAVVSLDLAPAAA